MITPQLNGYIFFTYIFRPHSETQTQYYEQLTLLSAVSIVHVSHDKCWASRFHPRDATDTSTFDYKSPKSHQARADAKGEE